MLRTPAFSARFVLTDSWGGKNQPQDVVEMSHLYAYRVKGSKLGVHIVTEEGSPALGLCKSEKALEALSLCQGRKHRGPDDGLSWVLRGQEFVGFVARELERTLQRGEMCAFFFFFLFTIFLPSKTVQVAGLVFRCLYKALASTEPVNLLYILTRALKSDGKKKQIPLALHDPKLRVRSGVSSEACTPSGIALHADRLLFFWGVASSLFPFLDPNYNFLTWEREVAAGEIP